MKTFEIRSSNESNELTVYHYPVSGNFIRGVFQIVHGMNEYVDRYQEFIEFLNQQGYAVIAHDQLGHGPNVKDVLDLGYFADKDGPAYLIKDVHTVNHRIHTLYPDVPIILLGHSMGSMISRWYCQLYPETITAFIMMGGLGPGNASENKVNRLLMKSLCFVMGKRGRSKFISDFAFKPYLKGIENPINSCAWLTKDEEICKKYKADPLCTFDFTYQGFIDILDLREYVNSDEWFNKFNKQLPMLITSGELDPCGEFGAALKVIYDRLNPSMSDLTMKLYPGDRHEILNELDKDQVYQDILEWANRYCKNQKFMK